jgi:hypothetical protein
MTAVLLLLKLVLATNCSNNIYATSQRGLSLSLQGQLLCDIEDQGGRTEKQFGLRVILNSKSDIYGDRNSKLRRQAQNKFSQWKALSSDLLECKQRQGVDDRVDWVINPIDINVNTYKRFQKASIKSYKLN